MMRLISSELNIQTHGFIVKYKTSEYQFCLPSFDTNSFLTKNCVFCFFLVNAYQLLTVNFTLAIDLIREKKRNRYV